MRNAWSYYHNSFENNQEEAVENIYDATIKHISFNTVTNINATIEFLKDLGEDYKAKQLISTFIEHHSTNNTIQFDSEILEGSAIDPDLADALKELKDKVTPERSVLQILEEIRVSGSHSMDDLNQLSKIDTDEFYKIFKEYKGDYLSSIIPKLLRFPNHSDGNIGMVQIRESTAEALRKIASESEINKRRIKQKYNINIDDDSS